ncbi:MAG: DedA family protein [Rhodospirillales bacterium 70-18]|nr:DedA family protein [Rhodospirillales bacterium]OJY65779.1 MAG: DedA family protein [Rhodospirillales bacterium 70-18]
MIAATLAFIEAHTAWAPAVVFLLAFGESVAFVSLLLPATVILLALGGAMGAAGIGFWPVWLAAALGAAAGDTLSYWIGARLHDKVGLIWPLSRYPALLPRGHAFFRRWGVASIFLGRFFGPMRAVVPLVAGMCAMALWQFQIANLTSAMLWAAGILAPGMLGLGVLGAVMGFGSAGR